MARLGKLKNVNLWCFSPDAGQQFCMLQALLYCSTSFSYGRVAFLNIVVWQDDIQAQLKVSNGMICSIKRRYCTEGLSAALEERPRPGAKSKLDATGEAHLIALACSEAPEGRESWTMQLLAEQLVEMGIVDEISDETVRTTLKKKTNTEETLSLR